MLMLMPHSLILKLRLFHFGTRLYISLFISLVIFHQDFLAQNHTGTCSSRSEVTKRVVFGLISWFASPGRLSSLVL